MSDGRAAARAIDALRRGWPVEVRAGGGALALLPVETADAARLAAFAPDGAGLLLSAGRALTLKLANQAAASDPERPVRIAPAPWLDFDLGMAAADPQLDLSTPIKGPLVAIAEPDSEAAAAAALRLARIAGLLPAYFTGGSGTVDARVTAEDIAALEDPERLVIATRARLPVAAAETGQLVVFRTGDGGDEHVALVIGTPDGTPPLVRLHSECLTGDVFGSLRCDCGPQLNGALGRIRDAGWGILLYLRQEGRGIGLVNKLRAYRLQDQGYDTFEANRRLGLAAEARDFRVAARMLALLGQRRVRLLTNNPAKVAALQAAGIDVAERVPLAIAANPHNVAYLDAKRDQSGHQL